MAKLYNLAAMTVANTGTGVLTLGSAATIMGVLYLSFSAAGASNGETLAYSISDVGASEEGTAVYNSTGPTITRTPVKSTNANAAINVTSAAIVRISPAKEDIANLRENNTFTGTQTINPTTGTTNQAVAITQTSQASGTVAGPVLFNQTDVTNAGISASGAGSWDNFGIHNLIYSHRFTMSITGANTSTNSAALAAITNIAAAGDGFGSAGGVTITGANPSGHNAWGHIGYGIGFINSSIGVLVGLEGEIGVGTGGTVSYRIGVAANSQGPVKGSVLDAAYLVSTINGNIPGSSTTPAPFDHLMAVSGAIYTSATAFPIASTGDFFYSDTAGTVAHFANLPNITVTGNILNFPNVVITGSGGAGFGGGVPSAGQLIMTRASGGDVKLLTATNTTSGVDAVQIDDSSGNNIFVAGAAEAANTATRFGQTLGNFAEVISTGSTNAGLLIGTLGSTPLILGTNNVARMTFLPAGGFKLVGTATNDNAAAGEVGEHVSSTVVIGSAVSVVNDVAKTVTSITLTAGDWDVRAICNYFPANTTIVTTVNGQLSLVDNTSDTTPGRAMGLTLPATTFDGTSIISCPIPSYRLSLASTTTVFLIARTKFSVSINTAYGFISARRIR